MAKKIKFSLEMDNEVRVRTLDELRANFSLEKVLEYYINGKLVIVLPHPSPLNIKWFKDHPEFMEKRIFEIRKIINEILEEK